MRKIRYYLFLKDVLLLAVTAFGGPQAHFAMILDLMVKKRRYMDEEELIELMALCQFLPGPTSTQTLTAIGYKVGGSRLAYLTLLLWVTPAFFIMALAGIFISTIQIFDISIAFTRFIQPMAVGIVGYSALVIIKKVVTTKTHIGLMIFATILSFLIHSPYVFPAILLISGGVTAMENKKHEKQERQRIYIQWSNFILWFGVLVSAAIIGTSTHWIEVRLFENFYRIGSLIFGGGQVLVPLLYTEFVEFKNYLTSQEFLSGFAMAQAMPGPVFSFAAYIGSIATKDGGVWRQMLGAFASTIGVFLPGTFLIFFIIRFWEALKKFRIIKASLEGVNAASAGMVLASVVLLAMSSAGNLINYGIMLGTFLILYFTKVRATYLIIGGLVLGSLI